MTDPSKTQSVFDICSIPYSLSRFSSPFRFKFSLPKSFLFSLTYFYLCHPDSESNFWTTQNGGLTVLFSKSYKPQGNNIYLILSFHPIRCNVFCTKDDAFLSFVLFLNLFIKKSYTNYRFFLLFIIIFTIIRWNILQCQRLLISPYAKKETSVRFLFSHKQR